MESSCICTLHFVSIDVLVNNSPRVLNQSFKCLIDGEKLNLHLIFMIGGVEKHHEFSVLEVNSVLYTVNSLQFNRYHNSLLLPQATCREEKSSI